MGHLFLLLSLFAPAAPACEVPARCTCIERPSVESARMAADAVFVGTVTSIREVVEREEGEDSGVPTLEIAFAVDAAWKGIAAGDVVLHTGLGGGDCGFPFKVGERYLVYGHGDADRLGTGVCTRTARAAEVGEELAVLGAPHWSRDGAPRSRRSSADVAVRPPGPAAW